MIQLQYKKTEVDFFRETYMIDGCKPAQTKVSHSNLNARAELQKRGTILYGHD